ncbi:MAG: hypothetical protein RID96_25485 [Nitratireductor sp.]
MTVFLRRREAVHGHVRSGSFQGEGPAELPGRSAVDVLADVGGHQTEVVLT